MPGELDDVLSRYKEEKGALIPILQEVQGKLGYLSEESVLRVAEFCRMSASEVFGVASFYAQFYFKKRGEHMVKVCLGTACHVRGGERILEEVKRELSVEPGEATKDYKFSLERVACFGSCALAPVVVVDKDVYGRMTAARAKNVLDQYRRG